MKIIRDESLFTGSGSVIALGMFDGVHIAHAKLIRTAVELAGKMQLQSAVFTFDRHPLTLLKPECAPRALLTLDEKLAKIGALGVDVALVKEFTREFAQQPPQDFLAGLVRHMGAKAIVVGENYTFGRGGAGNSSMIKALAPRLGYLPVVVEPVLDGGEMVSSTRIRLLLDAGELHKANRLLGIE